MQRNEEAEDEGRMKVIVRIRPFNETEHLRGDEGCIWRGDDQTVNVTYGASRSTKSYRFDSIFDQDSQQIDLFNEVVGGLQRGLQGVNCTIFTYGQTGTGKTYTMLGADLWEMATRIGQGKHLYDDPNFVPDLSDAESDGLIPRSMRWLFSEVRRRREKEVHKIHVCYLEIYNEQVYDLLVVPTAQSRRPSNSSSSPSPKRTQNMRRQSLDMRENQAGNIILPTCSELEVSSEHEILEVLWAGAKQRAVSATDMNEHSSRSHTIFQVLLESWDREDPTVRRRSKISLVDLAGSEKWKTHQLTMFSQQRIKELTSINQSLSNLGNVISALLQPNRSHVPYRNSKLTRLLQDSLGGNTSTSFIVTVSPSLANLEETMSTLQFADRAMRVQVYTSVNEEFHDTDLLKRYQRENARLKELLRKATLRGGGVRVPADGELIDSDDASPQELLEENDRLIEELTRVKEDLRLEKEEKRRLLEAIFGKAGVDVDLTSDNHDIEDISRRGQDPNVQLKILEVQRECLEQKKTEMEATAADQQAVWDWLEQYHTWLRSIPLPSSNLSEPSGDAGGGEVSLHERLAMMETSVIVQSQELKRAKGLFTRDRANLQEKISLMAEQIAERDSTLVEMEAKISDLSVAVQNSQDAASVSYSTSAVGIEDFACRKSPNQNEEEPDTSGNFDQIEDLSGQIKEKETEIETLKFDIDTMLEEKETEIETLKFDIGTMLEQSGFAESNSGGIGTERESWTTALDEHPHFSPINQERMEYNPSENKETKQLSPHSEEVRSARPLLQTSEPEGDFDTSRRSRMSSSGKRKKKKIWKVYKDPNTGLPYYFNRVSKETTWQIPDNLNAYIGDKEPRIVTDLLNAQNAQEGTEDVSVCQPQWSSPHCVQDTLGTGSLYDSASVMKSQTQNSSKHQSPPSVTSSKHQYIPLERDDLSSSTTRISQQSWSPDTSETHGIDILKRRNSNASSPDYLKPRRGHPKKVWKRYRDQQTNLHYYHNSVTGDVTWDEPEDWRTKTVDDR